jgi:hypothetical protein
VLPLLVVGFFSAFLHFLPLQIVEFMELLVLNFDFDAAQAKLKVVAFSIGFA